MKTAVLALFRIVEQAVTAIQDLRAAGFSEASVGAVMLDAPSWDSVHLHATDVQPQCSPEGPGALVPKGCSFDAALAATGRLTIPGIGVFSTGGNLTSLAGDHAGWLADTIARLDVPWHQATYLESQVQAGRILLDVVPSGREILASDILRRHGGVLFKRNGHGFRPSGHEGPVTGTAKPLDGEGCDTDRQPDHDVKHSHRKQGADLHYRGSDLPDKRRDPVWLPK